MNFVLQPWQLLLVILAGWVNRQPQEVIECLRTGNWVPREKLGKRRILLNGDPRRLAVKGKVLGRKVLEEIGTIVTLDTILRWGSSMPRHLCGSVPERRGTAVRGAVKQKDTEQK